MMWKGTVRPMASAMTNFFSKKVATRQTHRRSLSTLLLLTSSKNDVHIVRHICELSCSPNQNQFYEATGTEINEENNKGKHLTICF